MSFQGCWHMEKHLLNTFSLSPCFCVCVCGYSMVMSKIHSHEHLFVYSLSTFCHSSSLTLMCVCCSWPVCFLPFFTSPLSTVSITHLLLPGLRLILSMWQFFHWQINQKVPRTVFWDNILSVICCCIHCFTQGNTFWMIFISAICFLLAYLFNNTFLVQFGLIFVYFPPHIFSNRSIKITTTTITT